MNWSMALDGLLFWWFCLKPAPDGERPHPGYGTRAVILALIAFPQVILGCYIFLSPKSLYSVYNVCGRAWPISPLVDQQIGALIIWIPGAMMSVIAAIPVLRLWMRADGKARGGNTLALGVAAKSSRGI
jgi:putative membrane protein